MQTSFNIDNFILQKQIGEGSFGRVFIVKEKKTGMVYAAKISLKKIDESSQDLYQNLSREVNIIAKLNHPTVLKFIGYSPLNFKKNPKPVIITEYACNGSLEDLIQAERESRFVFNDTLKLIIIYGIVSAMSYLHANGIIHRDLKPANILLGDNYLPKIADFGLSKANSTTSDESTAGIKGTPIYMSPEIWESMTYIKAGDVYAFSLILYEIITNEKPFKNHFIYDIPLKVKSGYRPPFLTQLPPSYRNLIEACWSQVPDNRPTFDQILIQLKNDTGFITENVNKKEYYEFIEYISRSETSFDSMRPFIQIQHYFTQQGQRIREESEINLKILENIQSNNNNNFFNMLDLMGINESAAKIANDCSDLSSALSIVKRLIKGIDPFQRNTQLAMKMLFKFAMKLNHIDSLIYYVKILIKGKIVPRNLNKAKKLLDLKLKENKIEYSLLLGKINKKEGKFNDAKVHFERAIELNSGKAMYEYGKLLLKGKGLKANKEEAVKYFKNAIKNNCLKAMHKYGLILIKGIELPQNKEEGIKYIKNAADKGYTKALYSYSSILENNCTDYLKKAAYKGHVESMHKYGILLRDANDINGQKESCRLLKKACDQGHIDSMYSYADTLQAGIGIKIDFEKAAKYYRFAADNGCPDAMDGLGIMLIYGNGIPVNKEEGIYYVKKAIEYNSTKAMNNYGFLLIHGDVIPRNIEEGIYYVKMAIDRGYTASMTNYANYLLNGNIIPRNVEEAIKYFKMAIERGDGEAMNSYALALKKGIGVPQNLDEAIKYFKMGMEKNSTNAIFNYALLFESGIGVPKNLKEAAKYMKMAADLGNNFAMNNYGLMLRSGEGVLIDTKESLKYFKMGIDRGNVFAMSNYAKTFLEGWGVVINEHIAAKYFKMAADFGHVESMLKYAEMRSTNSGIPIDEKEASKYRKMASDARKFPSSK